MDFDNKIHVDEHLFYKTGTFEVLIKRKSQHIPYHVNIYSRNEEKNRAFLDERKLKEFIIGVPDFKINVKGSSLV